MNDNLDNSIGSPEGTEQITTDNIKRLSSHQVKKMLDNMKNAILTSQCEVFGNTMEWNISIGDFRVAHASCYYKQDSKIVTISSLYVVRQFRIIGLEDRLFEEIERFATSKDAVEIDGILGPELNCFGGWLPIERQKDLYELHGYSWGGFLCGYISFMKRSI